MLLSKKMLLKMGRVTLAERNVNIVSVQKSPNDFAIYFRVSPFSHMKLCFDISLVRISHQQMHQLLMHNTTVRN